MKNLIGLKLETVKKQLQEQGITFEVVKNNFIISGDTLLVTNAKRRDEKIVLTVGEFIFNVKKD